MKKFLNFISTLFSILLVVAVLGVIGGLISLFRQSQPVSLEKDSVLHLRLDGVILEPEQFLKDLREYRDNDKIKGVLVQVNSPGGAVGASQELHSELKRVREEFQKPVVVSFTSVAASGAYYAAVAADRIITNPGTAVGSIGVIMEFLNLKELYQWAHIKRYSLKAGEYKDIGATYRDIRPEERALLKDMLDKVHEQFKQAVMKGRSLSSDVVDKYSDGRVFTGETAVQLGFADSLGSFVDAKRVVGQLAGLGDDPELFMPPKPRPGVWELVNEMEGNSVSSRVFQQMIQAHGVPLYLMPGALGL